MKEIIQCVLPAILFVYSHFNFAWKGIYIYLILEQIHMNSQIFLVRRQYLYNFKEKKRPKLIYFD